MHILILLVFKIFLVYFLKFWLYWGLWSFFSFLYYDISSLYYICLLAFSLENVWIVIHWHSYKFNISYLTAEELMPIERKGRKSEKWSQEDLYWQALISIQLFLCIVIFLIQEESFKERKLFYKSESINETEKS